MELCPHSVLSSTTVVISLLQELRLEQNRTQGHAAAFLMCEPAQPHSSASPPPPKLSHLASHTGPRMHSDLKQEGFELNCQTQHEVWCTCCPHRSGPGDRHHGFVPRLSSSPTHDLVLTISSWIFLINLATAQNTLSITTTTHASQIWAGIPSGKRRDELTFADGFPMPALSHFVLTALVQN